MIGSRALCAAALALLASACDIQVMSGETTTLGGGGIVGGSTIQNEDGVDFGFTAARVFSGGTLIVDNATLLGGQAVLDSAAGNGQSGPGVLSSGTVILREGTLRGGAGILTGEVAVGQTPPTAIGPGLFANLGRVEILGGKVIGGAAQPRPGFSTRSAQASSAIVTSSTDLFIAGGIMKNGKPVNPVGVPANRQPVVDTLGGTAEIVGGDFRGTVSFLDTDVSISGGLFPLTVLIQSDNRSGVCAEIRGGRFGSTTGSGGNLFVAGSDTTLVLVVQSVDFPLGNITELTGGSGFSLTGVFENGQPFTRLGVSVLDSNTVILAPAGSDGCAPAGP